MFIDEDSIKLNNISLGQYLLKVKFGYHKIWGNDTKRTLSYKQVGTLGGIFPKLTFYFGNLDKTALKIIAPILDSASQKLTYEDPVKGNITIDTYAGDWEVEWDDMYSGEPFTCSVIAREKRS